MKALTNPTEDKQFFKIKQEKIAQMLEHAEAVKCDSVPIDKPIALTDGNFQAEVGKHKLIVVDFWAPWCGPCRMVGPIVEQLAAEYAGKVAFGKVNVDEEMVVAQSFGVQSIPTLMVFKDGKAVDAIVGACPKSSIEAKFKPYMESKA